MKIARFKNNSTRFFHSLTGILISVSYIALGFIVLITTIDVIGRYFLNKPFKGALELVELSMAVFGGFAMFYTTTQRGQISVDFLITRFSGRTRALLDRIGSFLGFVTWGVIAYRVFARAEANEVTMLLQIPVAPFQIILGVGLFLFCLAHFIQIFQPAVPAENTGGPDA